MTASMAATISSSFLVFLQLLGHRAGRQDVPHNGLYLLNGKRAAPVEVVLCAQNGHRVVTERGLGGLGDLGCGLLARRLHGVWLWAVTRRRTRRAAGHPAISEGEAYGFTLKIWSFLSKAMATQS